jgi:hypothetical protein
MMREIFIGPLRHWLLAAGVLGVMWWMGATQLHTHNFKLYLSILFALSLTIVGTFVLGHRKGERITRDTLEED